MVLACWLAPRSGSSALEAFEAREAREALNSGERRGLTPTQARIFRYSIFHSTFSSFADRSGVTDGDL